MTLGGVHILDDKNSLNAHTSFFPLLEFSYKLSEESSFCLFCAYVFLSQTLSSQQLILHVTLCLAEKCLRMV